ncbi:sulfonate ABC transporter substrate-binding protein [[Bacillus] caldolyticus]|uniref:Sulfonate ABC transporter substrate-binding protein n=1 Tax=Bacillus caldolyticus TaxID=1394 RepID=A0ABM6QNV7_BACCL|nr:aliphatic sulfonate ABC transporter substrate-binding protein [[Bacillus] caldolyticus]AUI37111.1 sulfonate ABC transporter substrate-binding protein [[Bacillus] caldolyticus]
MRGNRRLATLLLFLFLWVLLSCSHEKQQTHNSSLTEIRIGYQKGGTILLMKHEHKLQKQLEQEGYHVTWSEFNTGSSILEALNTGSIDFAVAGDIPSIFALAKGAQFRYIAGEPSSPASEGIIVRKGLDLSSLADLKGRKIALNKASIAEYLLVKALHSVGLSLRDVQPVYLNPPDASLALEKGEVDAWVVWDPFLSVAESKGHTLLKDGTGIVPYRTFYFSSPAMTDSHPDIVRQFVQALQKSGEQIRRDPTEAAQLLHEATNLPVNTWIHVLKKRQSTVHWIDPQAVRDLQQEADDLRAIGFIEKHVSIEDVVWKPTNK